ncbi:spherulin-2A-like [Microplitis mediator]|uniref:spherulin-2A-like n=1 Tax=Microplitis mediator TaxID=375433 RepID=UPI00255430E0|nr:spherulin-2A-like [Microplitis mediator]
MGITVEIQAGKDKESSIVNAEGEETRIISDEDIKAFGITEDELKAAVSSYMGQEPDDVYLRSPTPWGDLYKSYNKPEVTTTLRVFSSKLSKFDKKLTVVEGVGMTNGDCPELDVCQTIEKTVKNTVSSKWSKNSEIKLGQTISYKVGPVGGETSIDYTNSWGNDNFEEDSVEIKSTISARVAVRPNSHFYLLLTSSKGVLEAEIVHEASLDGVVAVNYSEPYKGHHFYFLPIDAVMNQAGISNSVKITETIKAGLHGMTEINLSKYPELIDSEIVPPDQ